MVQCVLHNHRLRRHSYIPCIRLFHVFYCKVQKEHAAIYVEVVFYYHIEPIYKAYQCLLSIVSIINNPISLDTVRALKKVFIFNFEKKTLNYMVLTLNIQIWLLLANCWRCHLVRKG